MINAMDCCLDMVGQRPYHNHCYHSTVTANINISLFSHFTFFIESKRKKHSSKTKHKITGVYKYSPASPASPTSPAPEKCINTSPAVHINTSPTVHINTSPAPEKCINTSPAVLPEKYL